MKSPAMSKLRAAAHWYAGELGWPVFPVRGKVPLTAHGFKDASANADQIDAWWDQWPDAGIGVPTGPESGLLVLDIDPRNGGDLAVLGKLPETPRTRTGGGGAHVLFQGPGCDVLKSLKPGYDLKAAGGYVVVPPSLHESGGVYEWQLEPTIVPLAPVPAALLDSIRRPQECAPSPSGNGSKVPAPSDVLRRAAAYIARCPEPSKGRTATTRPTELPARWCATSAWPMPKPCRSSRSGTGNASHHGPART